MSIGSGALKDLISVFSDQCDDQCSSRNGSINDAHRSFSQPTVAEKYATIRRGKKSSNEEFFGIQTLERQSTRFRRLTSRKKCEWLETSSDHGFIRLYAPTGSRSVIYPVTLETTVQDICSILGFEGLYLQIGGLRIRNLTSGARPLHLQNEILSNIGYETGAECMAIGDATHFTHIFCFYIGRPQSATGLGITNEILVASCNVRKGRILQKWIRRRCILYNSTIRIEHDGEDDEILLVSRYRADVCEGGRGKYLRLTESSHIYSFQFDAIGEMNLWLSRVLQTQMAPTCDLSDQHLLFLPDQLFSIGVDRQIISLNLRRNSLQFRPHTKFQSPPIGWLDDINRLGALRSLNIADNSLYHFPQAVLQLSNLTELILNGNRITNIPLQIGDLSNLIVLNLHNNWLKALPETLAQCTTISKLDLSFNRFQQIPDVLFELKRLTDIQLAGNDVPTSAIHSLSAVHTQRIDLRRNDLKHTIRLTSFICDALTELDIRDNKSLNHVDLSNLPSIQILHCERLQLTHLQINGTSLKYLYADYNGIFEYFQTDRKLKNYSDAVHIVFNYENKVIIMPIPIHLITFSVAHNNFASLPEWLTDLPRIETIIADHNSIRYLPYRIFMNVSSLRSLIANNNDLERLPDAIENCLIEVLTLHNNRLSVLPENLLRTANKLRNLNVSNNRLSSLPAANPIIDLNKLQSLRASSNHLTESVISTIVLCRRLRLLDLSYNQLRFFEDSCLHRLTALEEINLSANRLATVSSAFGILPNLQILRVHSNLITQLPNLSQSSSLSLLDISNNEFDNLDTDLCMAKTLKHLDLTCNNMLQVDASQIKPKKKGRSVSIFDVGSECDLSSLQFGFCETAGQKSRLCVRQIRPSSLEQPIFGIIDGGNNSEIPTMIAEKLNAYLQKQLIITTKVLKMALIHAHEHLGQLGQRLGASAIVLFPNFGQQRLLCATSGHARIVLCRGGNALDVTSQLDEITEPDYAMLRNGNATLTADNLIEGVCHCTRSLGYTFLYPAILPNPVKIEVALQPGDEFAIIATRTLWNYLSPQQAVDAIRAIFNPQIASKKLQDMVQSYEYTGNLSVIVIRFKQSDENDYRSYAINDCGRSEEPVHILDAPSAHDETILRNIEERLEQISEAISKIEDDSNNNRSVSSGLDLMSSENRMKRSVRKMKSHRKEDKEQMTRSLTRMQAGNVLDESPCTSRAPSSASAPPDPHVGELYADRPLANTDRFSIRPRIQMFDRSDNDPSSNTSMRSTSLAISRRERFQHAKLMLGEQLRFETPEQRTSKR